MALPAGRAVTAEIDRLLWLDPRHDAGLIIHAIFGDALAPREGAGWYAPGHISRGARVLMLRYEGARSVLAFCVAMPAAVDVDWSRLRQTLSPRGAETKWAPFVGQLGRFTRLDAAQARPHWAEAEAHADGRVWRVRRARHPSALMDRLLVRDRTHAQEHVHAVLAGARQRIRDPVVGSVPPGARCTNVGDKRYGES